MVRVRVRRKTQREKQTHRQIEGELMLFRDSQCQLEWKAGVSKRLSKGKREKQAWSAPS